jgi:hypothetical protein
MAAASAAQALLRRAILRRRRHLGFFLRQQPMDALALDRIAGLLQQAPVMP